ncbi:MAG: thioredoxin-dependent thiol peroxidase [Candidatus Brockarchaeota archaeon]|nr:thioredoxin-dependent thiol peroxidase [Candidatus Brockarchaeota archaeon]
MVLKEGDNAPDFTLQSDEGKKISLKGYRGRKVVLYFYPRDGTPGCAQEARRFRDLAEEFSRENVVIIGVSRDSVESHKRFKKDNDLPFTLLSDPEANVIKKYGAWGKKNLYGKPVMGVVRITFLIDEEGKIRRIYRNIKPEEHAEKCLLDLKSLGSNRQVL